MIISFFQNCSPANSDLGKESVASSETLEERAISTKSPIDFKQCLVQSHANSQEYRLDSSKRGCSPWTWPSDSSGLIKGKSIVIDQGGTESKPLTIDCKGGQIISPYLSDCAYDRDNLNCHSMIGGLSQIALSIRTKVNASRPLNWSSQSGATTWTRPSNIIIKNCKIMGATEIYGVAKTIDSTIDGEYATPLSPNAEFFFKDKINVNYTKNVQVRAPKNIRFNNVDFSHNIKPLRGIPLIRIGPGVTYTQINNSIIGNDSVVFRPLVTMDAESSNSLLQNNIFNADVSIFDYQPTNHIPVYGCPPHFVDRIDENEIITKVNMNPTIDSLYAKVLMLSTANNSVVNNTFLFKRLNAHSTTSFAITLTPVTYAVQTPSYNIIQGNKFDYSLITSGFLQPLSIGRDEVCHFSSYKNIITVGNIFNQNNQVLVSTEWNNGDSMRNQVAIENLVNNAAWERKVNSNSLNTIEQPTVIVK